MLGLPTWGAVSTWRRLAGFKLSLSRNEAAVGDSDRKSGLVNVIFKVISRVGEAESGIKAQVRRCASVLPEIDLSSLRDVAAKSGSCRFCSKA